MLISDRNIKYTHKARQQNLSFLKMLMLKYREWWYEWKSKLVVTCMDLQILICSSLSSMQQCSQYGHLKLTWFPGCPSACFGFARTQIQMHFNLQLSPYGHPMSNQNNSQVPSHSALKQKCEHARRVNYSSSSI